MTALLDALILDIGGTLVAEAPVGTATAELEVHLMPHVLDDLESLRATLRLAAATNTAVMGEAEVRALLAPSGLDALLEVVVTSSDVGATKPDPLVLSVVLDRLGGVTAERALFIGDQGTDAAAAAALGMPYAAIETAGVAATVATWIDANAGRRFAAAAAGVSPPDAAAAASAAELHDRLTKPKGALGGLEQIGIRLAGMAGVSPPPVPAPAVVAVFAGDHGVVNDGVTPWPQEVTAQMVANFVAGGAAINVLARHAGAEVMVVDVGVLHPLETADGLLRRKVRPGTASLASGPAMTEVEARQALDVGVEVAEHAVHGGARCLVTGDMGIGNTTPSAALIAAFTGRPAAEVTGRGTGVDDDTLSLKTRIVEAAVQRVAGREPFDVLAEVGGLEIAALAGFIVAGAAQRVPVVVDGVIATAALVTAEALVPGVHAWCFAGHRSAEPGAAVALEFLGLDPILDLGLRLGEGTGAALALPIVQAGAKVLGEMATFDGAGVTEKA
ncbi:MAG: nicotinate-nucleotide--dimethylbenzimidazole phosphoribosyltransferase [Actinobacteria bacterium]|nr:nicotinate-nucleotide--dimethylbenzimidazole phosphoribosyltransferase [Actinomycetota bacterium]